MKLTLKPLNLQRVQSLIIVIFQLPVDASQDIVEFQTVICNDNYVFVPTTDGIRKNNLTTKGWSRSVQDGKGITAIKKHPTIANKFYPSAKSNNTASYKNLYISNDGGATWSAGINLIFDSI